MIPSVEGVPIRHDDCMYALLLLSRRYIVVRMHCMQHLLHTVHPTIDSYDAIGVGANKEAAQAGAYQPAIG